MLGGQKIEKDGMKKCEARLQECSNHASDSSALLYLKTQN